MVRRASMICALSGTTFLNSNRVQWCDPPRGYGPPKVLSYRWQGWSDIGRFALTMLALACESGGEKIVMINATYVKAYRTATNVRAENGVQPMSSWRSSSVRRSA